MYIGTKHVMFMNSQNDVWDVFHFRQLCGTFYSVFQKRLCWAPGIIIWVKTVFKHTLPSGWWEALISTQGRARHLCVNPAQCTGSSPQFVSTCNTYFKWQKEHLKVPFPSSHACAPFQKATSGGLDRGEGTRQGSKLMGINLERCINIVLTLFSTASHNCLGRFDSWLLDMS